MNEETELTLLIADDEAAIRRGLCHAVNWTQQHIRVIAEAKTGSEAFEKICTLQPDIVITDIKMPDYDGLELIEKARKHGSTAQFIILSGYDDFAYAQRAMHNQVSSYLLKPVNTAELLAEVGRARAEILAHRLSSEQRAQEQFTAQRGSYALREHFYAILANGEYHSALEIEHALSSLHLIPIACPCVAVVFRFTLPKSAADVAHFSAADTALFKTALRNVVQELADTRPLEIFADRGNDIGILVSASPDLQEFLRLCITTMKIICKLELSAGIGGVANTLLDVAASCRAAFEAVEYHMYESKEPLFDSAVLSMTQSIPPQPPPLQKLAEALVSADFDGIAAELNRFFSSIFFVPTPPPRYVRGSCTYLMRDVATRAAQLMQYDSATSVLLHTQPIAELDTFNEIRAFMTEELLQVARHLQSCKKMHVPEAIEQAQAYIQANIFTRLRVESVAAQVHLSESHFTALFKKSTGITARDYILNCKLNKAKELLLDKKMSVLEIAEKLEYEDYRSFSRAFKRIAGCSPTEYRAQILQPQKEE